MRLLPAAFIAVIGVVVLFVLFILFVSRKRRIQFSVRGLLVGLTLVALLIGLTASYRRLSMAQAYWFKASSAQDKSAFPDSDVIEREGKFVVEYRSKRRSIQQLARVLNNFNNFNFKIDRESIVITSEDKKTAETALENLNAADLLPATGFVIRGQVIDRAGNPIRNATIDVMGGYVFINYFRSRDDGTFTMVLSDGSSSAPAGNGYYLRIRTEDDSADRPMRWNTANFALEPDAREKFARIMLPL